LKRILTIVIVCLSQGFFAQEVSQEAIKYAKTITSTDLSKHLHIISSDEYEGRETGYKGQQMTEEYLKNFYESVGIEKHNDTYLQYFDVILRDPKKVDVGTAKKQFKFLDDYYYYPGIKDTLLYPWSMVNHARKENNLF